MDGGWCFEQLNKWGIGAEISFLRNETIPYDGKITAIDPQSVTIIDNKNREQCVRLSTITSIKLVTNKGDK